ncbi:MAG TPA: glycosyltransferase [Candidatus Binatia bacterium]
MGRALGHEVALFGKQRSDALRMPYSLDVKNFDFAIFIIYETQDLPELPYLARLLNEMPKSRRIVIDCWGRYNDTIRVEHDSNHFEKLDGHKGWEWIEAFRTLSDRILQPTSAPLRDDVHPFLFHGYDPGAVVRPLNWALRAARTWIRGNRARKPYGVVYVGHNWQRWTQIKSFLEAIEPLRTSLGPICLAGWRWDERLDWAVERGIDGVDVDPLLLKRLEVETKPFIPFEQVIDFESKSHFSPIFHRPLFNHLRLVTNRAFETFCADTIPLLMLPDNIVKEIYGEDALLLAPGNDIAARVQDMRRRPEKYCEAVRKTRAHLAAHHSYRRRFEELLTLLES